MCLGIILGAIGIVFGLLMIVQFFVIMFGYIFSFLYFMESYETLKEYQLKFDAKIEERTRFVPNLGDLIKLKRRRFSVFKRFYIRKRLP